MFMAMSDKSVENHCVYLYPVVVVVKQNFITKEKREKAFTHKTKTT